MEAGRRPIDDLWQRTLSQIPTLYGRLVYLSSLRNSNNGRYEHHGLAMVFGEDEANQALEESHVLIFRDWLRLNLEQQKADLDLYLSDLPTDRRTLVESWTRLIPYRNLIPINISEPEAALFLGEVEAILSLLRNETGGARKRPGGLPHL